MGELTPPEGCVYCGISQRYHVQNWVPGVGYHGWTRPPRELVIARTRAIREARAAERAANGGEA